MRAPYVHIGGKRKVCGLAGKNAKASTKLDEVTCPQCVELYLGYLEKNDGNPALRGSKDVVDG